MHSNGGHPWLRVCAGPWPVKIGSDCHLAMRVTITTSTHDLDDHTSVRHLPVTIGDRVGPGVGVKAAWITHTASLEPAADDEVEV